VRIGAHGKQRKYESLLSAGQFGSLSAANFHMPAAADFARSYCGKKYLPDKLPGHLRFFCGPDADKLPAPAAAAVAACSYCGKKCLPNRLHVHLL
jgi:hypothetical protein